VANQENPVTNVYKTPDKAEIKRRLFEIGVQALKDAGYRVGRAGGGSSVRQIIKEGEKPKLVSIRTTQDRHIAFPPKKGGGWRTLDDVDMVVAVSVDDRETPRYAWVHFLPGDDMRARFNRTYEARRAAGLRMPNGRGVWLSLYKEESSDEPRRVGAGAGLVNPKVAVVPLDKNGGGPLPAPTPQASRPVEPSDRLTIAEAKRRLAASLGVDESSIKIFVEA
jgi:hypothetical protein